MEVIGRVDFTPSGGRMVTADGPSLDKEIFDANGFRSLDLVLTALALGGPFWVRMETALTLDEPEWQSLGLFTPLVAAKTTDRRTFTGVLRFVRWRVESVTGSAAFTLAGTAV